MVVVKQGMVTLKRIDGSHLHSFYMPMGIDVCYVSKKTRGVKT